MLFADALPLVTLPLALFFAFMLNVGGRRRKNPRRGCAGSAFYKIVYFFPQVLSIAIVALLFGSPTTRNRRRRSQLTPEAVGLDGVQPDWLGDPDLALWCIIAVMVWCTVGFFVVLFSAAMASIPTDIYEAALLDGANRFTHSSGSPCRCSGTPCRPAGSTWASSRSAPGPSRSCRS